MRERFPLRGAAVFTLAEILHRVLSRLRKKTKIGPFVALLCRRRYQEGKTTPHFLSSPAAVATSRTGAWKWKGIVGNDLLTPAHKKRVDKVCVRVRRLGVKTHMGRLHQRTKVTKVSLKHVALNAP